MEEAGGLSARAGRERRALALIGLAAAALMAASVAYAGPSLLARPAPVPASPPAAVALPGLQAVGREVAWLALYEPNAEHAYAVFKTTDAGAHWQRSLLVWAQQPLVWMHFFDADRGFVLAGTRGVRTQAAQLYQTRDGGAHWTSNPLPIENGSGDRPVIQSVWFADPEYGWYLAGLGNQSAVLYRTFDGGRTWEQLARVDPVVPVSHGLTLDGRKARVFFANHDEGWIGLQEPAPPTIFHTLDGGSTWRLERLPALPITPGDVRTQVAVAPPAVFGRQAVLMVSAADSYALVSGDGGGTWSDPRALPGGCCAAALDAAHWWVADGVYVHATEDAGRRWRTLSPPLPAGVRLSEVVPASRSDLWALGTRLDALGNSVLLRSADGGETWATVALPALSS